jgi:hypothetical protein
MHEKKRKGDLAVAQVIARLAELGWVVGIPLTEHAPYDLFAEKDGVIHTVQVRYTSPTKASIKTKLVSTWADRHGVHRRPRRKGQFSLLAIYAPGAGIFFITDAELGENCREVCLRLSPTGNCQKKGVRMARSFLSF